MESKRASDIQIAGNHYREMAIQPSEFIQRNSLNWCEGNIIKYLCRHRNKNGAQDVQKAIHYAELLLEWEYSGMTKTAADYTPLAPAEIHSINSSISPPSLCGTCIRQGCPVDCAEHTTECGEYLPQGIGGEPMPSKQWTHEPEAVALSLALPSITVEGDLKDVHEKYEEERQEWGMCNAGKLESDIEAWDVVQVRQTYAERGGNVDVLTGGKPEYVLRSIAERYADAPEQVLAAKRAMIVKNAARAMYAPEVCLKIVMSGGKDW